MKISNSVKSLNLNKMYNRYLEKYLIEKFYTDIGRLIKYQKCLIINYPSRVQTTTNNIFNKLTSERCYINY